MALQNAYGNLALDASLAALKVTDPDGTAEVALDPTTLLMDSFDTNLGQWVVSGTSPTVSNSLVSFASTTNASTTSYMRTQYAYPLPAGAYLRCGWQVRVNTAPVTNNTRWWGYGVSPGSPTAANPLTHGLFFLLDYAAGIFQAVVYSAGAKTFVANLSQPTDGALHRYEIWYRHSVAYWLMDGLVVATAPMPQIAQAHNLYVTAGSINHTTAPGTSPVLVANAATLSDTGRNGMQISDANSPNVKATVRYSGASASTDSALVVGLHPSSPLPAGTNLLGAVTHPAQTTVTATAATGTAVTATLPAAGAGLRHHVTAITVEQYCTAATTGSATPIVSTVSNHTYVTTMPTALAVGTMNKDTRTFTFPLASTTANTATSFTLPATTGIIWRVTVSYHAAA